MMSPLFPSGGGSPAAAVTIYSVPRERLLECQRLAAEVFDFSDAETIPAWQLYTSTLFGGLTFAAAVAGEIVGFAAAFPARDRGRGCLLLCELSVLPAYRSQGVGRGLLTAVANGARERGCLLLKWTTNALNSRNLYLYLHRCKARLVAHHPSLYVDLIDRASDGVAGGDEVEIEWDLSKPDAAALAASHRSPASAEHLVGLIESAGSGGVRRVIDYSTSLDSGVTAYGVEVPLELRRLQEHDHAEGARWREGVRATMTALLGAGFVGTDVLIDRVANRSTVVFERAT